MDAEGADALRGRRAIAASTSTDASVFPSSKSKWRSPETGAGANAREPNSLANCGRARGPRRASRRRAWRWRRRLAVSRSALLDRTRRAARCARYYVISTISVTPNWSLTGPARSTSSDIWGRVAMHNATGTSEKTKSKTFRRSTQMVSMDDPEARQTEETLMTGCSEIAATAMALALGGAASAAATPLPVDLSGYELLNGSPCTINTQSGTCDVAFERLDRRRRANGERVARFPGTGQGLWEVIVNYDGRPHFGGHLNIVNGSFNLLFTDGTVVSGNITGGRSTGHRRGRRPSAARTWPPSSSTSHLPAASWPTGRSKAA